MNSRTGLPKWLRFGPRKSYSMTNPTEVEGMERKWKLGFFSAVCLIVGNLMGSGIFVFPHLISMWTRSYTTSIIIVQICGFLTCLGALVYSDLGTSIPVSGADFSYYLHAYGRNKKWGRIVEFVGPIPAFVYFWTFAILWKPMVVSVTLLTLAHYAVEPVMPGCSPPTKVEKLIAFSGIWFITLINCFSVQIATILNNVAVLLKMLATAIIVFAGFYLLCTGHSNYSNPIIDMQSSTASFYELIVVPFYIGFTFFEDSKSLNFVTEELVNPVVNLPLANFFGITLVTFCYVSMLVSYYVVLTQTELLASESFAMAFAGHLGSAARFIMPLLIAASAYGYANGTCITASRLHLVAAREGHSAKLMSCVQVNWKTPIPALIFNGITVFIMIAFFDIFYVLDIFFWLPALFYFGTMLTSVILQIAQRDLRRPFKVIIAIPVIMVIVAAFQFVMAFIAYPRIEYLYGLLYLLCGFLLYIPFVYFKLRLKLIEKITRYMQIILNCAPEKTIPD